MKRLFPQIKLNPQQKYTWAALGIFILSVILRGIYLYFSMDTPLFQGLVQDVNTYIHAAIWISRGVLQLPNLSYMNLLYPFVLAAVFSVAGTQPVIVCLFQILVDSLSCLLVYRLCLQIWSSKEGLIAAALYCFYGMTIFYSILLLGTTLSVFLVVLLVNILLHSDLRQKNYLYALSGILYGLLVLLRQNLILILPFLLLWLLSNGSGRPIRPRLKNAAFLGLGLAFILLFSAGMHQRIENRFTTFSSHGGINFYIGNNPDANGQFMSPQGVAGSPIIQIKSSIHEASRRTGRSLTPAQASEYWAQQSFLFIRKNPVKAASLLGRKILLFWRREEIPLNVNFSFAATLVPFLKLPWISFGMIAPLALAGVFMAGKGRKVLLLRLMIAGLMFSVVIFFVSSRYRMPVIPVLISMASFTIIRLATLIRSQDWQSIMRWSGLVLVFGIIVNWPLASFSNYEDPVVDNINVGTVYLNQGRLSDARASFRKALQIDPLEKSAHYNLALTYHLMDSSDMAIALYKQAIALDSLYVQAYNNLANIYVNRDRLDSAETLFRQAIDIAPSQGRPYYGLGEVMLKRGNYAKALEAYKKCISLMPGFANGYFKLGIVMRELGDLKSAQAAFSDALRWNPNHPEAGQYLKELQNTANQPPDSSG